jgi:hypothetical protein
MTWLPEHYPIVRDSKMIPVAVERRSRMSGKHRHARIYCVPLLVAGLSGCGGSSSGPEEDCTPDASYSPSIDPANFVAGTDNTLWPLVPGTRYVYHGGNETIEVTVTQETKQILCVTTIVVHDVVSVGDEVIEDTYDWYARDKTGNVWYLGEDTKEYEGGILASTEGSWEAGMDGAKPGIVMHATQPAAGSPYRQEYYACEAEDMAEVVSLSASVTVAYGSFSNCLQTREYTPLDPDVNEYKYYAPGVGLVLEVDVNSDARTELVEVTTPWDSRG